MADGSGHIEFDFRNPDYVPVFHARARRLAWIRSNPAKVPALKLYYRENPAALINDWGMTFDPRNADIGLPSAVPFLLFPKQKEWISYTLDRWQNRKRALSEKSRDMGISWLAVSTSVALCVTRPGLNIGFGSRTEDDVDKANDPDSLFWKARFFVDHLPQEFRAGYNRKGCTSHMLMQFPETGSTMKGDAGNDIGRGGRASIYFVDEAAKLQNAQSVEASLSQTTNARHDISTPAGRANKFAENRFSGKIQVFTFGWRDDPRKDEIWYAEQQEKLDAVTLAQEVDLNYDASVTGILIPNEWVQAAVDAHVKLGFAPTGARRGALDVADEGIDLNAFARAHGVVVQHVEAWSGKGSDIFDTVVRAFGLADDGDISDWWYDADGLGAGVRGDARVINAEREKEGQAPHNVEPFRGSGEIHKPDDAIPVAVASDGKDRKERKNKDFFLNAKAQAWWGLRVRFQRTFRAVQLVAAGKTHDYRPDDLISLDSASLGTSLSKVTQELSQPTYSKNTAGKVIVDKAPDNTRSPNHGDAIMILFAPRKTSWLDAI